MLASIHSQKLSPYCSHLLILPNSYLRIPEQSMTNTATSPKIPSEASPSTSINITATIIRNTDRNYNNVICGVQESPSNTPRFARSKLYLEKFFQPSTSSILALVNPQSVTSTDGENSQLIIVVQDLYWSNFFKHLMPALFFFNRSKIKNPILM